MQRARILLIFGIWTAVLPYLGFPLLWKNILFTLTGLVLICFAFILYKEFKIKTAKDPKKLFDTFSENRN